MVKWSIHAQRDLKTVYDFIAKDSKHYALRVIKEIVARSESLIDFPFKGRIVPEIGNGNIREIFIYSYRLIYQIGQSDIEVLTLLHAKQDFPENQLPQD